MKSSTSPEFWRAYAKLSPQARESACKAYRLWKENPPSRFAAFSEAWTFLAVCFGEGHRARAVAVPDGYLRFWIGTHDEYERLLKGG
jgi:hypothetical protein